MEEDALNVGSKQDCCLKRLQSYCSNRSATTIGSHQKDIACTFRLLQSYSSRMCRKYWLPLFLDQLHRLLCWLAVQIRRLIFLGPLGSFSQNQSLYQSFYRKNNDSGAYCLGRGRIMINKRGGGGDSPFIHLKINLMYFNIDFLQQGDYTKLKGLPINGPKHVKTYWIYPIVKSRAVRSIESIANKCQPWTWSKVRFNN